MEQLKQMKTTLTNAVCGQIGNLAQANYQELGAAVDMIKDIAEAEYYCSIVKAMEEGSRDEMRYYSEKDWPHRREAYERDDDYDFGRMYYPGARSSSMSTSRPSRSRMYMHDDRWDNNDMYMMRDVREGRSGLSRKTYMETKATHDKEKAMKELDHYMKELSEDITDMIKDATSEEKAVLQQKLQTLVTKVSNV